MISPFGNIHIETNSQDIYTDYPVSSYFMTGFTILRVQTTGEVLVYDARRSQPSGYDCLAFVPNGHDASDVARQLAADYGQPWRE